MTLSPSPPRDPPHDVPGAGSLPPRPAMRPGVRARLAWFVSRSDERRPFGLLTVTLLTIVGAGLTALVAAVAAQGDLFCTVTTRLSGDEIPIAAGLVLAVCPLGFAAGALTRHRPRLLWLTVTLVALALAAGIALVTADAAVSRTIQECTFMGTSTETDT